MGALVMLASRLGSQLGIRSLGRVALGGGGRRALVGTAGGLGVGKVLFGNGDDGGDGASRRRRRRPMFTSTDLAQFAAAEAIGGKKAATSLMMIRAAKS